MQKVTLIAIMLLYMVVGLWGFDWGLDVNLRIPYLFPASAPWNLDRVKTVVSSAGDKDAGLAADVDPDPLARDALVVTNDSDDGIAQIYVRYLLYSHQPDEMITLRAFRHMDPAHFHFDPGMYQYGGMFIYPVGALIKAASLVRLVKTGTPEFYIKHPREFSRLFLVGRMYVLLWGLLGVLVVYALGWHLAGHPGGALSALCYVLLPVVVSLSHEFKPHLPAVVLMLWAVLSALNYQETGRAVHRYLLAITAGLAVGMVISSVWILVLIPVTEMMARARAVDRCVRAFVYLLLAVAIYAVTNPYVIVNLIVDRDLLLDNLRNSAAMYQISEWSAGLHNAGQLLGAAASWPIVVLGAFMLVSLFAADWRKIFLMVLPAALVYAQFVALAAGKPGEYGRFALLPAVILTIAAACGVQHYLAQKQLAQRVILALALATAVAWPTLSYLENFHWDSTKRNSRYQLAEQLQDVDSAIAVLRDPAPYNFPPIDFSSRQVVKLPQDIDTWPDDREDWPDQLIVPVDGIDGVDVEAILSDGYYRLPKHQRLPVDRARISWANKPLVLLEHEALP